MNWQGIECAPRDGTRLLLTNGRLVGVGHFERGCYYDSWTNEAEPTATDGPGATAGYWQPDPTHWMPLPEPPK